MRIAIASSDGKVVNQHFGRADVFFVADTDAAGLRFAAQRETQPLCSDFSHDEDALTAAVALLHDCQAVFAAKVGPGAAQALFTAGIRVFEAPGATLDDIHAFLREGEAHAPV